MNGAAVANLTSEVAYARLSWERAKTDLGTCSLQSKAYFEKRVRAARHELDRALADLAFQLEA